MPDHDQKSSAHPSERHQLWQVFNESPDNRVASSPFIPFDLAAQLQANLLDPKAAPHPPNMSSYNFGIDLSACNSKPSQKRWHPRITPYRLVLLLTTIVLGTVKAVLTYLGKSMVSTTVEWINGVAIALLFYFLGDYELKGKYAPHISWFFSYDCMNIIWRILGIFSFLRPAYESKESKVETPSDTDSNIPPLTGYRLLVSSIVTIFGVVKAICSYLGLNAAANTLDWTLGVALISILYVVGLYESNTLGLAPSLFDKDYTPLLRRLIIRGRFPILIGLGLFTCGQWFWFCLGISFVHFPEFIKDIKPPSAEPLDIFTLKVSALILTFLAILVCLAPGIVVLLLLIVLIKNALIPQQNVDDSFRDLSQDSALRLVARVSMALFLRLLASILCVAIATFLVSVSLVIVKEEMELVSRSIFALFFLFLVFSYNFAIALYCLIRILRSCIGVFSPILNSRM